MYLSIYICIYLFIFLSIYLSLSLSLSLVLFLSFSFLSLSLSQPLSEFIFLASVLLEKWSLATAQEKRLKLIPSNLRLEWKKKSEHCIQINKMIYGKS